MTSKSPSSRLQCARGQNLFMRKTFFMFRATKSRFAMVGRACEFSAKNVSWIANLSWLSQTNEMKTHAKWITKSSTRYRSRRDLKRSTTSFYFVVCATFTRACSQRTHIWREHIIFFSRLNINKFLLKQKLRNFCENETLKMHKMHWSRNPIFAFNICAVVKMPSILFTFFQ